MRWVICGLGLWVLAMTLWQGRYVLDPHHWGLMLSNAIDLAAGKMPYRDIFIQYGLLTTALHALAYKWLGGTLLSLIALTAVMYVVGLLGVYVLGRRLGLSPAQALMAFALSVLAHPVVIYPWSNYMAFPFLIWGLVCLLPLTAGWRSGLTGGLLLALAVLCREGLFWPVIVFAVSATVVRLAGSGTPPENRQSRVATAAFWAGLLAPWALFALLLQWLDVAAYWYQLSVELPRLYIGEFFQHGVTGAVLDLARYLVEGAFRLNPRLLFFLLIGLAAAWVALAVLWRRPGFAGRRDLLLVALFCMLLFSATLHLPEIFRLSTGSVLGAVLLPLAIPSARWTRRVCWVLAVLMTFTFARFDSGNYFFPSRDARIAATRVDTPPVFAGQRWPAGVAGFYEAFRHDLQSLSQAGCGLKFQYNETRDVFLVVLSPFQQYQVAPFGKGMHDGGNWGQLRPDIDVPGKRAAARDLVIWAEVEPDALVAYTPPPGYVIYSRHRMPLVRFQSTGNWLLVLVPAACRPETLADPS